MGKGKKSKQGLGRALINNFKVNSQKNKGDVIFQKESDFVAGQNKLASKINQSPLQQFMLKAQLQGNKFQAQHVKLRQIKDEKLQKQMSKKILLENFDKKQPSYDPQLNSLLKQLRFPRKPQWSKQMNKQQLFKGSYRQLAQTQSFIQWRRALAQIQQKNLRISLTPYQKNLEVWKQFWRVLQKSDIVVQVVDARDPLFFYCQDIDRFVQSQKKKFLLLINKSDLVSDRMRQQWDNYLNSREVKHIFFSAKNHIQKNAKQSFISSIQVIIQQIRNSFQDKKIVHVGMIGFPNVGKSSVINCLFGKKKVSVASMPGKTKHMQSLLLSEDIVILDCPGLVFPHASSSFQQMILNGIIPIDKLKAYQKAIELMLKRIPKVVIEHFYGMEIQNYLYNNVLFNYAKKRGYFTGSGLPNEGYAARLILKDYIDGNIIYMKKPPNCQVQIWQSNNLQQLNRLKVCKMIQTRKQINQKQKIIEEQKKIETQFFIQKEQFNEEDILDLIEGKTIKGLKLNKQGKRELKFSIKRGQQPQVALKQYLKKFEKQPYSVC